MIDINTNNSVLISFQEVHKSYIVGKLPIYALRGVTEQIQNGEFVSVIGPSGSGKSTLLHLLGGLDTPTQGNIIINKSNLATLSSNQLADFRLKHIGFIFQSFNLISSISSLNNVLIPLVFSGKLSKQKQIIRAKEALSLVGLTDRFNHFPGELSGGEQQRVAVARAIANNPTIILADEPTGDLDSKNGLKIIELLKELNKKGQTIVMVTHDINLAKHANRTIELLDGKIIT